MMSVAVNVAEVGAFAAEFFRQQQPLKLDQLLSRCRAGGGRQVKQTDQSNGVKGGKCLHVRIACWAGRR